VAEVFHDSETVNQALRLLVKLKLSADAKRHPTPKT
jgi:hypothetical protein